MYGGICYNGFMKIGVFDSGKGGTTVLEAIRHRLPDEEYIYVADAKNCPYGEKSDEELFKIVDDIVSNLLEQGAKIIVIACNTATTRCIAHLREKFPDTPFIGTEPAVKLATKLGGKKILVLATPGTASSERLLQIIEQNMTDQTIDIVSCPGLADAIENDQDVDGLLAKLLETAPKDYDTVVLGCTHYSLIKDRIASFFSKAKLIDGNDGVARRVEELIRDLKK